MSYTCFTLEVSDAIATLCFNRPEAFNSMTPDFWRELPEAVADLSDQGHVRALIIASTGKHFCAGMDLSVFTGAGAPGGGEKREVGRQRANLRDFAMRLQDVFTGLERARMPVLTAIQGGCIGGAVDMVTAADMRYCTADAFFCVQEINIGMTADVGTLQRLPKIIPEGIARELAYTGRRMSALEAKQCGLVNRVYDTQDEMLAGVREIALEIAKKSPLAIWGTKESINYARDHTTADALNFIATWQSGMYQPQDMAECFTARAEKRDPVFEDLIAVRKGL